MKTLLKNVHEKSENVKPKKNEQTYVDKQKKMKLFPKQPKHNKSKTKQNKADLS